MGIEPGSSTFSGKPLGEVCRVYILIYTDGFNQNLIVECIRYVIFFFFGKQNIRYVIEHLK